MNAIAYYLLFSPILWAKLSNSFLLSQNRLGLARYGLATLGRTNKSQEPHVGNISSNYQYHCTQKLWNRYSSLHRRHLTSSSSAFTVSISDHLSQFAWLSNDGVMAFFTIITSSLIGYAIAHRRPGQNGNKDLEESSKGENSSMYTLFSAMFLSNLDFLVGMKVRVPKTHALYDIVWSKFLPSSLALLLLSSPNPSSSSPSSSGTHYPSHHHDNSYTSIPTIELNEIQEKRINKTNLSKNVIFAMFIPFIVGLLGSILGCYITAKLQSCSVLARESVVLQSLKIPKEEVSIVAGALCASYIGGTINFFSVARILSSRVKHDISSILTSIAAADLVVMSCYFALVTKAVKSKRLRQYFPGRHQSESSSSSADNGDESNEQIVRYPPELHHEHDARNNQDSTFDDSFKKKCSTAVAALIAWVIVSISIRFENLTKNVIPGMGCLSVAVLGSFINSLLNRTESMIQENSDEHYDNFLSLFCQQPRKIFLYLTKYVREQASTMSEFSFLFVFAVIGISADIGEALSYGPSSFCFAALSLIIHIFTILFGSFSLMKIIPRNNSCIFRDVFPLSLEEIVIASNALIGGALTAASFAGNLEVNGSNSKDNVKTRMGWVYGGTLYGIIGYSCANIIGKTVDSHKLLNTLLLSDVVYSEYAEYVCNS